MTLRRSIYLSFGRTGGSVLIQFVTNIVLARLLAPAEIGVFMVALAATMTIGALRDFGIPRYVLKERDLTDAKLATVFGVAILFGWTFGAALYLVRHTAADFYGAPVLADILAVLAVSFIFLPIGQPAVAMLRREQRHDHLTVNTLTATFGGSATSISFAALGFGPISMAYGSLVASVLTSALALRAEPAHLRLRPSLREWRSVLGFGSVATAGAVVVQLEQHAPALFLGRFMGFAETGLFQRAHSLSQFVPAIIVTSTNWVTGAAMGERFRAGADMSALAFRTTDYLAVTGWPALVFLALKAEAVIYLLYGAAWLPAAPVLPPLCIAAGITIFASQTTAVYEGTGAAGLHLRNHALALAVAVALLAIGVQYSLLAVAWLRVPAIAARVFLDFSVFRRYARIEFGQMVWAVRRALLVTAGVALVLQGMILLEPPDTVRDPFILFAELAVAGAFYLGLLFVLRHSIRCEVVRVLTRLVARFRAGR